jgi:hypothetical protein
MATTSTGKVLRGRFAQWVSKDQKDWTLIGIRQDSQETSTNIDSTTGKDVTGGAYVDVSGYSPETSVDYIAREEDSIFQPLWEIYKGLKKDDTSLTFYKLEALLDIEVSETNTATSASGDGFIVPVKALIQSAGGDTNGFHINTTFTEDHSSTGREAGTVKVSDKKPTFTKVGASS